MASDESPAMLQSFSMQDNEHEFDDEGDYNYRPGHPHNLSEMSMCTNNSTVYGFDDDCDNIGRGNYFHLDDGYSDTISMRMSQLSMESFHSGDAGGHEDFSDDERECKEISGRGVSSDSDLESLGDCHLSPATPPRPQWRNQSADLDQVLLQQEKHKEYYTSKNKAKMMMMMNTMRGDRCRLERETSFGDPNKKKIAVDDEAMIDSSSEGGSGDLVGRSMVIKTRPRGGGRSLCMDLEEVKACRDLGFDLEHDHRTTLHSSSSSSASVVIMPTTTTTSLSISETSTLDTSSGTNSPITKWRISSPGDDPRDVKARLRVWAQAVALASTSWHCC
ncbi:hypothetical protein RHMOL_Rhmol01G0387000 [Rhododendron molle]|uniref:Uncharacterized protein n=1 Tax=Rhododendron molle TaxID=49168 RepID=A0ACC0QAH9_RHOML|nr:hypothetical protein RHMOL_Rhmol01G0387000 [Rhododendron molle]